MREYDGVVDADVLAALEAGTDAPAAEEQVAELEADGATVEAAPTAEPEAAS